MKVAWVRPGAPSLNGPKAERYKLDGLCYDATDRTRATAEWFAALRGWHYRPWLTRSADWGDPTGRELAILMDADVTRVGADNLPLGMVADIEAMWQRGSAYVLEWLNEWRKLRPTRRTIWTTEPLQGGTVSDTLAARINADVNLLVVPQLYDKNMTPYNEGRCVAEMIQTRGRRDIDRHRVTCYYAAHALNADWDGLVFDFDKLP
jgi:hypothetical protein